MQTYAYLCLLGAVVAYCFTDAKHGGTAAKIVAFCMLGAFAVTEAISLVT
jgi:hypothetical protein